MSPRDPETRSPYSFELARCLAFDLEVSPSRWAVGFHGPDREGERGTWVVQDREKLARFLNGFASYERILVGYNSQRFDVPLVRAILKGLDPYALAQAIIRDERFP